MDNKEILLKKIKTLAEKGVGGEKINAKKMLDKLMKEYCITEKALADDLVQEFPIKIKNIYHGGMLASQIAYSMFGNEIGKSRGIYIYSNKYKKRYVIQCTSTEFLEFTAKYDFYAHHLKNDLELFFNAFIQSNNIFPPVEIADLDKIKPPMSEEDFEVLRMTSMLNKHEYNLQIEGGK